MSHDPRGSIWRQWDLHIHSPASFHWTGPRFSGDHVHDDGIVREMVEAVNAAEPAAYCIMDYWTFDGWFALRRYVEAHPEALAKTVFPGLELRLEAPTDYRLNTHFLFDPSLSDLQLREFLGELRVGVVDRAPSPECFRELGRTYDPGKLKQHGFTPADRADDPKMVKLGMMTAKITRDSWRRAARMLGDKVLIVQPYDTSDGLEGLEWKRHPYDDTELMRAADFFESRHPLHVRLFLGIGDPNKPALAAEFKEALGGRWRPVVSGSDAHRFQDYGRYPEGKLGWVKADLTYAGLRQCLVDPVSRVYVGALPPKLKHLADNPTKYMTRLRIRKVAADAYEEKWFDCDLPLNPGMIAVIGNKGSGKSAFADIVALAGNSHCPSFEFLNSKRFRKTGDNKAIHFEAILSWANGEEVPVRLDRTAVNEEPERVRYLPQQYVEELCAEVGSEGQTTFERELRKIVFSHVPVARRLGLDSLEGLVKYRTQQAEDQAAALRRQLAVLDLEISEMESALRAENLKGLQSQIDLRESELQAHDVQRPADVERPQDAPAESEVLQSLSAVRESIETATRDRVELLAQQASAEGVAAAALRLLRRLRNLDEQVRVSLAEAGDDARVAGLELAELVQFAFRVEPVSARAAEAQEAAKRKEVELAGATAIIERLQEELAQLHEKASAPQRKYQEYVSAIKEWEERRASIVGAAEHPGTLEGLRAQLRALAEDVPTQLKEKEAQRKELTRRIYQTVVEQLEVYRELYGPIAAAAAEHQFVRDHLRLEFNVVVEASAFVEKLLANINQGRRGTFYGQIEGTEAARKLVQSADFATWEGVDGFLERVLAALTHDQRDGRGDAISVSAQLRDGFAVGDIYDVVFGLGYLRPRLTLQLGGKEVAELSPGERGILLLVFYLLLDKEEIPLVIDQPEHNLDNASVYRLLGPCIRRAKNRRQIVLVTHNPNVAIACDAEQVIAAEIDKLDGYRITYRSGSIENPILNLDAVNVLEGTWPAFDARDAAYQRIAGPA